MSQSETMNAPKVRPKVLLWTLLFLSAVASAFFAGRAWTIKDELSALDLREPEISNKAAHERTQIENETDIQELRRLAVNYHYRVVADWLGYRDRLHGMSEALLWASLSLAIASAVLGYSIYGLRIQKQVA